MDNKLNEMKKNYIHHSHIHNPESSGEILPIVLKTIAPNSIIDIGCGLGDWLLVAELNGITDYLGVDNHNVDLKKLYIPEERFIFADLTKPLTLGRKFDLAICLEVGEHLPEKSSISLVKTLTDLSDNILFSAAIPGQGGQNHINEKSYEFWINLFENSGYKFYDLIRPQIWRNSKVKWWYKQNIFLVSKNPLQGLETTTVNTYIHPDLFYKKIKKIEKITSGNESPIFYGKLLIQSLLNSLK